MSRNASRVISGDVPPPTIPIRRHAPRFGIGFAEPLQQEACPRTSHWSWCVTWNSCSCPAKTCQNRTSLTTRHGSTKQCLNEIFAAVPFTGGAAVCEMEQLQLPGQKHARIIVYTPRFHKQCLSQAAPRHKVLEGLCHGAIWVRHYFA